MEERIKLIWDFRGPNAKQTAEHHQIHLVDYLKAENKADLQTGVEVLNEFHVIAFMLVEKAQMKKFRDVLKPHRGQLVTGSA
jgi:hypothetical protein